MLSPVRERERPPLFAYSPRLTPHIAHACLDKLRIVFPNHSVSYSGDGALRSFIRRLTPSSRDGVPASPLFSRGKTPYELVIRDGWLFSGKIKLATPRGNGRGQGLMNIDLMLNPSRFYAHVSPERLAAGEPIEDLLRIDPERRAIAATYALDGADNVLPLETILATRPFLDHTMRYIEAVTSLIQEYIERVSDVPAWGGFVQTAASYDMAEVDDQEEGAGSQDFDCRFNLNWSGWRVYHTEVYWEYRVADAVVVAHRLAGRLHAAVAEAETNAYGIPRAVPGRRPDQPRWRTNKNAISTRTELGGEGNELIVYAKEFDRLRFEVRYQKNLRQAMGREGAAGRRASRDELFRARDPARVAPLTELPVLLRTAIENASVRLSRVFMALADMETERPASLDGVAALFAHVFAAVRGDQARARRVLSLLVHNLAISETGLGDLVDAIRELRVRGVLVETRVEQRRSERRYRLAAAYLRSAEALRRVFASS